jgi:hypothetical protein
MTRGARLNTNPISSRIAGVWRAMPSASGRRAR